MPPTAETTTPTGTFSFACSSLAKKYATADISGAFCASAICQLSPQPSVRLIDRPLRQREKPHAWVSAAGSGANGGFMDLILKTCSTARRPARPRPP